jgi:hypothetical protein
MAPLLGVPERQSKNGCLNCWANQWATDEQKKDGHTSKACRTYIRVVGVIPALQSDGSWDGLLIELQLAPTSLKNFESLRVRVESYRKRALRSVMTRVSLDPTSTYPVYVLEPFADITDSNPEMKGLAAFIPQYPLGKGTAIRQHLLRGWNTVTDDGSTYDDLPPPTDDDAPPPMDDDAPF